MGQVRSKEEWMAAIRRDLPELIMDASFKAPITFKNGRQVKPSVIQFTKSEDGDWMCCYLDGVEIDQGHSFDVVELLKTLSVSLGFTVADTIYYDDDQMDEIGNHFPERLEDIDAELRKL